MLFSDVAKIPFEYCGLLFWSDDTHDMMGIPSPDNSDKNRY